MTAEIAMDQNLTPAQPCAQMVHPGEVTTAMQHAVSRMPGHAEAVSQPDRPPVTADWEVLNIAA